MCFWNWHFGPLFWTRFWPRFRPPPKSEKMTPPDEKSEKSVKKLKKWQKKCQKPSKNQESGPPQKVRNRQNRRKKSAKKVKTRPLKVSRIYVFLKLAFRTSFFGPVFKCVSEIGISDLFFGPVFNPDFDPPKKWKNDPPGWKKWQKLKKVSKNWKNVKSDKKWPPKLKKVTKSDPKKWQISQIPGVKKWRFWGPDFRKGGPKSWESGVKK